MIKSHRNLGLFLIALSFLPWVAVVAIVPLLPLSVTQKTLMVPVLAVVDEAFARSPDALAKFAARAMAEYQAGKTQELNPESDHASL